MEHTKQTFQQALAAAQEFQQRHSIGVQQERLLHAFLKYYLEPDRRFHEIRAAGFVADILKDGSVTEVQTRDLYKLRRKLEAFLPLYHVTITFPVETLKWLTWVEQDGTLRPPRKSPKRGTALMALPELYALRAFLPNPQLAVTIALLQVEEYRYLDGWSHDKKRGSHRVERVPAALDGLVTLRCAEDYRLLLPAGLPERFTVKEFAKASRLRPKAAWKALHVLTVMGAAQKQGKQGREDIYVAAL